MLSSLQETASSATTKEVKVAVATVPAAARQEDDSRVFYLHLKTFSMHADSLINTWLRVYVC